MYVGVSGHLLTAHGKKTRCNMCIICYKPKGKEYPSKKEVKMMWLQNSDGGGFMYSDGESITIKKGFMTFNDFYREYQKIRPRKDYSVIMHFRIATHGGISKEMCQPFPMSRNNKDLKALFLENQHIGIAHNGIIDMCSHAKTISDTALFIRDYMIPLYMHMDRDIALDIIGGCTNGSRLAIMHSDGDTLLLGKWIKDNDRYYSNDSYKKPKVKYTTTKTYDYNKCNYDCDVCDNVYNCYGYGSFTSLSEWGMPEF